MATYDQLIEWLEKYWRKRGVSCYRGLEYSKRFKEDVEAAKKRGKGFYIDPALPVDLVTVERKPESEDEPPYKILRVNHYKLFWIVLSRDPGLEGRLRFYQFYLSRVSELKRVKMIIVSADACPKELINQLNKIAKRNRFGLWKVNINKQHPEEIRAPKHFRELMKEEFENPSDPDVKSQFSDDERADAGPLSMFFETPVRDAIEAVVGITPEQVGKRYIDRNVLDLVFDLKHISYRGKLQQLVTDHLCRKGNDYDFVTKAFSDLWEVCDLKIKYSDFLKRFEPALYHIFAGGKKTYRDHYIHQFQVFLLGVHIIDNLHTQISKHDVSEKVDKQWLVASSFHDVAYPVQLFDSWSKTFFRKIFRITEVGAADLKSQFISKTLLGCMGYLIDSLCQTHLNRPLTRNWLANEKDLIRFFYEKITMAKHHCVLSSVSLLKKASEVVDPASNLLTDVFVPAALAISLHDEAVWSELKKNHKLSEVSFDNDPITFLLLFCDCVQEWGRPKNVSDGGKEKERFLLKAIHPPKKKQKKYSITIWTPDLSSTDDLFKKKVREGANLENFLRGPPNVTFEMRLADSSGKVKKRCTILSKTS
jgi:hypothetical protein